MDYPDIECLQRLVAQLTKELEATLESFARLDRRVRTLELARTSKPVPQDVATTLDSGTSGG
jgi:hypothetical protein